PAYKLMLKVGISLLILQNIHSEARLYNETNINVTQLIQYVIGVKRFDKGHDSLQHLIPELNMTTNEREFSFCLSSHRFPICSAFAMTIKKLKDKVLIILKYILIHLYYLRNSYTVL
ncbi:hypothetical protein F4703DRAFT_1744096, partial [Phycomyces blakesleeanus]